MGGAERIVHVEIAQLGEPRRECAVVALFLRVEPDVFEQQNVPVAQCRHRCRGRVAHAVRSERDRRSEAIRQGRR